MTPLTVIGGFLGAGKTTLLNRWLEAVAAPAGGGPRLAVLVNDFGAINIDAALIAAAGGDTIALTNGCVCCQIGGDLIAALAGLLARPERFDGIIIEASGVSDPWKIALMGRADPDLTLDGVIVLVDAGAVLDQLRDPYLTETIERPLQHADLVILNKADQVDAATLAAVEAWLDRVAPAAARCTAVQADVPLALLGSAMLQADAPPADTAAPVRPAHEPRHEHEHEHEHSHDDAHEHGNRFETWSCRPSRVFDEAALRAWLRDVPAGVLRAKGILRTGPDAWSVLQFAGRHGELRATGEPADGPAFVAIGLRGQLPASVLSATFG